MKGPLDRILTLNLIGTVIVFYIAARIYLLPDFGRSMGAAYWIPRPPRHPLHHVPSPDEALESVPLALRVLRGDFFGGSAFAFMRS